MEGVPHCCSEAGTLALSRPDIAHKMLSRKKAALLPIVEAGDPTSFVTNCPACLQGLGCQDHAGARPLHLAVLLARAHGGADWQNAFAESVRRAEVVTF